MTNSNNKSNMKELYSKSLAQYSPHLDAKLGEIERKNKEQNHKISILTNELDNDYLTKTEEGSVISLDHSKEGMVYIDSLEGNTMVNYCTDGSKELTLNGDIDLEGTFVTTTDGVDNGKVDVMCEGNTLFNLVKTPNKSTTSNYTSSYTMTYAKENTEYTIGFKLTNVIKGDYTGKFNISIENSPNSQMVQVPFENGVYKIKVTTRNINSSPSLDITKTVNVCFWTVGMNMGESYTICDVYALEGDYLDKDIICFEGMKSVGQDDENGHKIEILSNNKNLLDNLINYPIEVIKGDLLSGNDGALLGVVKVKPNTKYIMSATRNKNVGRIIAKMSNRLLASSELTNGVFSQSSVYNFLRDNYANGRKFEYILNGQNSIEFTTLDDCNYIYLNIDCAYGIDDIGDKYIINNVQIEEGTVATPYEESKYNKKEILMNEPLRRLPNEAKDRIVKIGNKCFIERNCKELVVNTSTQGFSLQYWNGAYDTDNLYAFYLSNSEIFGTYPNGLKYQGARPIICDKFPYIEGATSSKTLGIWSGLSSAPPYIGFKLPKNIIDNCEGESVLEKGRNYLKSIGDMKFIVEYINPTYEPLEIEPTLNTYNDITHISNNSTIPCNMQVKNTGYNAIIKPSTLYTIALDTNKSGTIGMNLGGVKGTATNNVLTLTTPATLSDDSLRLYGKGIKGSKIRLLEGDKTNWIPSFFEGMKSCFEDKDNNIEINVVNKNLFDINKRINKSSKYWWVIPKGRYNKMSFKFNTSIPYIEFYESNIDNIYNIYTNWTVNSTFKNVSQGTTVAYKTDKPFIIMAFDMTTAPSEDIMKTLQVIDGEEIPMDYTPQIINKIQFSSIEPLRGIGDVKDKFVLKDGKLMIERKCGKGVLGSEISLYHCWDNNPTDVVNGYIYYNEHMPPLNNVKTYSNVKNNLLPSNQGGHISKVEGFRNTAYFGFSIHKSKLGISDVNAGLPNQPIIRQYFNDNPLEFIYQLAEPTYEEVPFELAKIILEVYENGTLFFDTNIPPTSTVTYAGETPIVKSVKLNKTEVLNNTNDINDNIIPYLMDMDYRVVCLQLETNIEGISMAKLFGGAYEMLKRDIQSKRYSTNEYKHRLNMYLSINKITEKEYEELGEMLNE